MFAIFPASLFCDCLDQPVLSDTKGMVTGGTLTRAEQSRDALVWPPYVALRVYIFCSCVTAGHGYV